MAWQFKPYTFHQIVFAVANLAEKLPAYKWLDSSILSMIKKKMYNKIPPVSYRHLPSIHGFPEPCRHSNEGQNDAHFSLFDASYKRQSRYMEMSLSESTTALIFATFSAVRAVTGRPNLCSIWSLMLRLLSKTPQI